MARFGLSRRVVIGLTALSVATVLSVTSASGARAALTTTRISLSSVGGQGNGASGSGLISADGSHVAFDSLASNLVAGDTNGEQDVFVRDRATGKTTRVSVSSAGKQANRTSTVDAISPTGRFVLFSSLATDLIPSDTNGLRDVFLRDTVAQTTVRVSVGDLHVQLPGSSVGTSMTPDASMVVFTYHGAGFQSGCRSPCVVVRNRSTDTTTRISSATAFAFGARNGLISANGRYVAFTGDPGLGPGNLYRRDLLTNTVISQGVDNIIDDTAIDGDGNRIVFDRQTGTGGNFIVNTLVWQVAPHLLIRISRVTAPNAYNVLGGAITADGRYVTYATNSPGEVSGDTNHATDVFRRDTQAHITIRVSLGSGGGQLAEKSTGGSIVADGSMAVFSTRDASVVSGDTNAKQDVFVRGVLP